MARASIFFFSTPDKRYGSDSNEFSDVAFEYFFVIVCTFTSQSVTVKSLCKWDYVVLVITNLAYRFSRSGSLSN